MAIYMINGDEMLRLDETTFNAEGIRERQDLQRLLRESVEIVAPDTLVLAEEFGEWEDSRRRIDLLGLDTNANLVVIELKRTEDGGHMELQALRYAAMVSTMTFSNAVRVHQSYLENLGKEEDAESAILEFLGWDEPREEDFAQDIRIILASAEFSKELTSAVMWLNDHDIDIRCVRLRPYRYEENVLLDVQQIIPLPEATDYQVKIREKAVEKRLSRRDGRDLTRYDLKVDDKEYTNLPKRRLIHFVVYAAVAHGVSPEELLELMPGSLKMLAVDSECGREDFLEKATNLRTERGFKYDLNRFFTKDDELLHFDGRTYALTKMWGAETIEVLDSILSRYPHLQIKYQATV